MLHAKTTSRCNTDKDYPIAYSALCVWNDRLKAFYGCELMAQMLFDGYKVNALCKTSNDTA